MAVTDSVTQVVWEDTTPILMARVVNFANTNITQASLSEVRYMVKNRITGNITVASVALTIGDVVFDALQTDAIWTKDNTGYNFKTQLAVTAIPGADQIYKVPVQFKDTATPAGVWVIEFILPTKGHDIS